MMEISFQRLKLESGRALIMETGGVRGHICSWGWLTSLARLSHGLCELSWKSKVPKSMRTEYAGIHSRFHPFWVPFFLLFACVCVFVLTVTVKGLGPIIYSASLSGWSAKISHIYSKFLRFLSFWWFRYDLHKPMSLNETSVESKAPSGTSGPRVWEWVRENLQVCYC